MKRSVYGVLTGLCFALALSLSPVLDGAPAEATTWVKNQGGDIHYYALDFVDASRGWVGGITYTPDGMVGIEDTAVIGRTTTAGTGWTYSTSHHIGDDLSAGWNLLTATALDFVDVSHGWAALSDGTILATTDAGEIWLAQAEGSTGYADNNWGYASLAMADLVHGCAVGGWVGLIGTTYPRIAYTNNGTDWTEAEFEKAADSSLESVCMVDPEYGWAVGSRVPADGMPLVLVTHDGGATWNRQTKGLPATGIGFHGVWFADRQRGWAVGDQGAIYTTVDGGATWWNQPSGTIATLLGVRFASAEGVLGWAVGEKGTILETHRAGLSWVTQASGTTASLRAVAGAEGTVWIAGEEGTLLAATAPSGAVSGPPLSDIASSPYQTAIESLAAAGIVDGFTDGTFRPEAMVRRAQFAKMIVGVLDVVPSDSTATRFVDLGSPDVAGYPHRFVQAAFDHGITYGVNAEMTLFAPWEPIRRDQVVTMLVRGAKSLMTGVLEGPPPGTPSVFADVGEPHGENLRIAEYNGLLDGFLQSGDTAGSAAGWDATVLATRGEVAQLLYNLRLK